MIITTGRLCSVRNAGVIARHFANYHKTVRPPSAGKHFPDSIRANSSGSPSSASSPSNTDAGATVPASIKYAKTTAGTGDPEGLGASPAFSTRGPVTWPALGLVAIAAASAVAYYKIERERRLENAMGKIVSWDYFFYSTTHSNSGLIFIPSLHTAALKVSSESGWSPNPELLARRKYVKTEWGWFPKEDAFGGGE
jgi:hypothetical protein